WRIAGCRASRSNTSKAAPRTRRRWRAISRRWRNGVFVTARLSTCRGLFWPHADLHLAEAAAKAGIPFAQSTMSNEAMEAVARVPGLRFWWQLYVFGPPQIRDALIDRAAKAGCEALIVTTDAQIYGNREWASRTRAASNVPNLA